MAKNKTKKNRISIIDEIRGAMIILVVIYHLLFDLTIIYRVTAIEGAFTFFSVIQPVFPFIFIFISGISFCLSKNNLKRGLILLAFSAVITIVTWIATPDFIILFGIIHLLALVHILFAPLKKFFAKIPLKAGIIICAVCVILFELTYGVAEGYFGLKGIIDVSVPDALCQNNFLMIFGFHTPDFISADYFPVLPWVFPFIIGIVLGKYIHKLPETLKKPHVPPLAFLGRHTLIIYIAHQPIIYGILWLIFGR